MSLLEFRPHSMGRAKMNSMLAADCAMFNRHAPQRHGGRQRSSSPSYGRVSQTYRALENGIAEALCLCTYILCTSYINEVNIERTAGNGGDRVCSLEGFGDIIEVAGL